MTKVSGVINRDQWRKAAFVLETINIAAGRIRSNQENEVYPADMKLLREFIKWSQDKIA